MAHIIAVRKSFSISAWLPALLAAWHKDSVLVINSNESGDAVRLEW
jgi:hypothetical protein